MDDLEKATSEFITAVLGSEIYKNYRSELDKVKQFPELKERIDEFRRKNYELQSRADNNFDMLDRFEKEYESFREESMVSDFLAAELDLCRTLQDVVMTVTRALDFQ